ncbi:MAG: tyrosine-type recombinase/integrase [Nitrososphaera sp.]|nr:tyrosine-type recombinase/integrase [Nitrososphaera sp.]
MSEDILLVKLERRRWITDGPLDVIVARYLKHLREQRYSSFTIQGYLKAIAHFSRWLTIKGWGIEDIDDELIEYFVCFHLPHCRCPAPRSRDAKYVRAGLRHLKRVLLQAGLSNEPPITPIEAELEHYKQFLVNVNGSAPNTCKSRMRVVRDFLLKICGERQTEIDIGKLNIGDVDDFIMDYAKRWKPSSLAVVRSSLRSYLKFRAVQGDSTELLVASMPNIAPYWNRASLPSFLSDEDLKLFLQAFDRSHSTGLRDYAAARCLIDLGLRSHEVAQLSLESFDWRNGTITISRSKSRRIYKLPLPRQTGEAIVRYLRKGRPKSNSRTVFARQRAPYDKPLTKNAISNAIAQAFVRCEMKFRGTHILRRTLAVRLQRAGVPLKEIADVLRHKDLSTTKVYTRVDLDGLRAVALPWPGRQS